MRVRGPRSPFGVASMEISPDLFEGSATIDMRLFGLKPPTAALGAVGTDPWMKLSFKIRIHAA